MARKINNKYKGFLTEFPFLEGEEKIKEDGNNLGEQMHSFLILPI